MMPVSMVDARSVHATHVVDLFPEGEMDNAVNWSIKRHLSFTPENNQEDGQYVYGIVANDRMTLAINMPHNIDAHTIWSSSTSTDSNATMGSPDGAYTWSTGPDITMGGFQTTGYESNIIESVNLVIHFQVPHALQQDKVRFSVINNGMHDLVKNWANTQSGLFYMTNGWSIEITDEGGWTWSELSNLEINLDYVSVGGTDDSQLNVDAVGLNIEMQTPWYGAERVTATASHAVESWPVIDLDFGAGELDGVSTSPCGLESTGGTWSTETIAKPSGQSWGRVHLDHEDEINGSIVIEYLDSTSTWISMDEGLIPMVEGDLSLRFTITDTCLKRAWIDINDPTIRIIGSMQGDIIGINSSLSAWIVVVNGVTISNKPVTTIGVFDFELPIGHLMDSESLFLNVTVKAFYTWESDGSDNNLSLVVNRISVTGGYFVEYDEDPTCSMIGSHELQEDGGGLILPLLSQCSDDRTDSEDLIVTFENSNSDVVAVDLTQGQVRVRLIEEGSGVSQVTTTVTDTAGNSWSEVSTFTVVEVDDSPVLAEFPPTVPVQLGEDSIVPFSVSDIDSLDGEITVSTNRSWATVNLSQRHILVTAPTPGFTSVLVTACDESSCVERILDLEVRSLPDLLIEELRIDSDNFVEGDIVEIKVMVRNSGQVSATMISVRCFADEMTIGIGIIPVLQPGELGFVICDWQIPSDDDSVLLEASVDNGTEIDETDESNNRISKLIGISPAPSEATNADDTGFQITQTMTWGISIAGIILIVTLFGLLAPAKIKKVE